jgi:DNA-binding beta-propeller fold protein YncE
MALERLSNNLRIIGGFELSLAEFFGNSFDVSGSSNQQATNPTGIAFNPDGTRMFVVGDSTDSVFQYSLSTGFDVSTASFSGTSFDVSGQTASPEGVAFNSDGTRMFIVGNKTDSVFQYSLSTGFDLSTASFSGTSFDVSGQETTPKGVAFSSDGTRMFVVGTGSDSVFEYSLNTGFDVSTASFSGTSFDISGQQSDPADVVFSPDGTRMFIPENSPDSLFQYSLSNGFDISTASFSGTSFDVSGQATAPTDVAFNPNGTSMFVIETGSDFVFEYLIGRLTLQE